MAASIVAKHAPMHTRGTAPERQEGVARTRLDSVGREVVAFFDAGRKLECGCGCGRRSAHRQAPWARSTGWVEALRFGNDLAAEDKRSTWPVCVQACRPAERRFDNDVERGAGQSGGRIDRAIRLCGFPPLDLSLGHGG
jgi:hypothetical protein